MQQNRGSVFEIHFAGFLALLWDENREFKKLRRQLQRKRHIKIELCVKLSLLRLLYIDQVVQNRRMVRIVFM